MGRNSGSIRGNKKNIGKMKLHIVTSQKRGFNNELIVRSYVSNIDITKEGLASLKKITGEDYIAVGYNSILDNTVYRGDNIWANADERVVDDYGKFKIAKDEEVKISEKDISIDVINATEDTLDERIWKIVHSDWKNAHTKKEQIRLS